MGGFQKVEETENKQPCTYLKVKDIEKNSVLVARYKLTYSKDHVNKKRGNTFTAITHVFENADGTQTAIDGNTDLNDKISRIEKGSMVRIKALGEQTFTTAAGKQASGYGFIVEVLPENGEPIFIKRLSNAERAAQAAKEAEATAQGNSLRTPV